MPFAQRSGLEGLGDPEDDELDEDDEPADDKEEKINDDDGEEIHPIDDPDRNASS